MQINELQKKRAVNQIWNAAKNHDFTPDFKAYDKEGNAELYWNIIIGAVRRHYEYPKLEKLFLSFMEYEESELYEGLLWLGLENAVFHKELTDRPILKQLRVNYARRFVDEYGSKYVDDYHLYDYLALAHFSRVIGIEPKIKKYSRELLDELEFSPELGTDEIVELAQALFKRWFQIRTEERKQEKKRFPTISFGKKSDSKSRYLRFGIGFADHPDGIYGSAKKQQSRPKQNMRSKLSEADLRRFMIEKYGLPLFDEKTGAEIERELCRDNHQSCRIHFTRGEPVKEKIQNAFEALHKTKEAKQIQKNKDYYSVNLAQNRVAINKLAAKIQNSILMHLHPASYKSNSGVINAGAVWRAAYLDDNKVFIKNRPDESGGLSVDILLDASTSQETRQESISSQAHIIAESLNRCSIPCRVMSFCSMTGYTIMRIYRDYNETRGNGRIFDYVSNGCNRDGLAIRAARHLMLQQSDYEHRMLIVLSDVKPNDIVKIRTNGAKEYVAYEKEAGLNDVALEVRRAKAEGISVICVFTGEDEDIPSAKYVYGRDFARIKSIDMLAETVGNLIQNQIKLI